MVTDVINVIRTLSDAGIFVFTEEGKLKTRGEAAKLTPEIVALVKSHKEALIAYLERQVREEHGARMAIQPRGLSSAPLSFAQQRLWLLDQIDGGSAHYNMPNALRLSGQLDRQALERAFGTILERHESLRTCFRTGDDGQPLQVVVPAAPLAVALTDLSPLAAGERDATLQSHLRQDAAQAFDLGSAPMLRAALFKLAPDEHVLLVTMHHIAADGWSIGVFVNEFSALYRAYVGGAPNPLPALAIQYADYASWQRDWLQGEVLDQQLGYWKTQLAGLPVLHGLPLDRPRPQLQTFAGALHHTAIDAATTAALRRLCLANGATLFMGLHSVFSALLSRYSNETDIVVGTPIANREQAEVAPLIGFFVNTLVLRGDLSGDPSFLDMLGRSRAMLLAAYAHQQVPFEQIVESLQPQRSSSHGALFQIMLILQNNEEGSFDLPGLTLSSVAQAIDVAKYELTLNVTEHDDVLALDWGYNTDLFAAETVARMAEHFTLLLRALLAAPAASVFAAPLLTPDQRQQQASAWGGSVQPLPALCMHELFEASAAAHPDAIALEFESEQLSYAELDRRANRLAHHLLAQRQLRPDDLVGICLERSLDSIVAILAVLKTGAAFLPLDPSYPAARLAYLCADARPAALLTWTRLQARLPEGSTPVFCLDDPALQRALGEQPDCAIPVAARGLSPEHLAYVIYTSGSTGNPKGVLQTHRTIVNLVQATALVDGIDQPLRTLQFASGNFDVSVQEIATAWHTGGTLVLLSEERKSDLMHLPAALRELRIERAFLPPAVLHWLAEAGDAQETAFPALRQVFAAGEALAVGAPLQRFMLRHPQCQLWNHYGPTETHVATRHLVQAATGAVPIGTPVPNLQVCVLDRAGNPVPAGVAGELHIGGAGLARGYLRRPDLDAEKFLASAAHDGLPRACERWYRSGDLVRWLPGGILEYLGRMDQQVKIRGFRVELGEVEAALTAHPDVMAAVALAHEAAPGDVRLVAYLVGAAGLAGDGTLAARLRSHLAASLPPYMIPSAFVPLERLPLTANGKVDRKALPQPDFASLGAAAYLAPRTDTERALCALCREVLGVEQVGLNDNFFQLGGHSLSATRLVARVNQQFGVSLPIKAVFGAQTLEALAQAIEDLDSDVARPALVPVARDGQLPPSYAQQRLWLLDQIDGGSAHYNIPSALRLRGQLDREALDRAFSTIVARHESLRTCFEAGPDGEPRQIIQAAPAWSSTLLDLSALAPQPRRQRLQEIVAAEAQRGFDLGRDLMLRTCLLKLAADEHILLVTMHHIASDGWSIAILVNELSALYGAYVQGQADPLPPLPLQYADYAHWQRNWLQGEVLERQLDYWSTQLADLPAVHSLPLDFARPARQSFNGAAHVSRIDAATTAALNRLCREAGATLFMGLHAAFSALMARYSNSTDIVLGSPIANREQAEVAGLIGFFVNTLVLRSDLSGDPDFTELLARSKRTLLDAYAHQQVPFEQLVERLQPQRSLSHSPLFQVLLVLQNNDSGELDLPGLTLHPVEAETSIAKYDLALTVGENADGLYMVWEYNCDLFRDVTIAAMADHFGVLLASMVGAPGMPVSSVPMIGRDERRRLLQDWSRSESGYVASSSVQQRFEQQAAHAPQAVAIRCGDQILTYAQLDARANQLARHLRATTSCAPDTLIAVCVERSVEAIVGMLAILKAGAAYLPLDPTYPDARLRYMLADGGVQTVLVGAATDERGLFADVQCVCLGDEAVRQAIARRPAHGMTLDEQLTQAHHLAYVIYTSGSTGQPKGVMVEHGSVVSLVVDNDYVPLSGTTVMLHNASVAFDAATFEIWGALLNGGTLVVQPAALLDMESLGRFIERESVNTAWMTSGLFDQFVALFDTPVPQLAYLLVGGDVVSKRSVTRFKRVNPGARLINGYGPTENTTFSCCHAIVDEPDGSGSIPIGRPLRHRSAYVVSRGGQLQPARVAGELYVGGSGLARGYLNQPALTADKFVAHPFGDEAEVGSDARVYRTGDLVCWRHDGTLEFLGRIDQQVKLRGFRIELGEIEYVLTTHPAVGEAVVVCDGEDKHLVAFVAPKQGHGEHPAATSAALRQHLAAALPSYMVPHAIVLIERLPLTANGKVDRKALPWPATLGAAAYLAPRTDTERALCALCREVLGVEQVGLNDNFFQLGGHSLSATRLVARVNQQFGVSLPIKAVFGAQTLEALAQAIEDLDSDAARPALVPVARDGQLPPSYAQQRLWLLDQIDGGSAHYNIPSALRLRGQLDREALDRAFSTIVARHESLRTCFEAGPDGEPRQIIQAAPAWSSTLLDLSALAPQPRRQRLQEIVAAEAQRGFDLGRDLMLRTCLLKLAADEHILLVTMHHIASDGWSIAILVNELSALYGAYVQGQADPLPPLPLQYADYAHWQRNWLQGEVLERQLDYWSTQLADLPAVHSLPLDFARPARQSFNGAAHVSRIDAATTAALNRLCREAGATLFMGLHAAFSALLARYSNSTDIVLGSPIANREQAEVAGLIGFFVNTLVLRSDLSGDPDFTELLARSKRTLLDAYAHQQVPFEQLVERLQPQRSLSHSALFQVLLVLQNNEEGTLDLPGLQLSPVEEGGELAAKYDLTLTAGESADGLSLAWQYNADLFAAPTIARMAAHFGVLLEALIGKPEQSVLRADMLDPAERRLLVRELNETAQPFPDSLCLHQLFERHAAHAPHAPALVFEDRQVSFGDLNARANRLAHYLSTQCGVGPDTLVGLCVERSFDMLVGILAILKAGGAYVPLDPAYPQARLAYMLGNAKLDTVLTQVHVRARLPLDGVRSLCLDDEEFARQLSGMPDRDIDPRTIGLQPQHLAYVIYTSGSTGNPKGVMIAHRSVVNLASNLEALDLAGQGGRWGWLASYAFDGSVKGLTQLMQGRCLVIVGEQCRRDPALLAPLLAGLDVIDCTPLLVEAWFAAGLGERLPNLIIGGEAISTRLWQQLVAWQARTGKKAVNVYGPTECTVDSHCCVVAGARPNIGAVMPNLSAYVLNGALAPAGLGVPGELHLGGVGLARGYWELPGLSAERFIPNPFHVPGDPVRGERLYKTGDLVRSLADGSLEYLGRIDHQVKIRGFRIELGEIEHALRGLPAVRDTIVLAGAAPGGGQYLVAYVAATAAALQDQGGTVRALREQLGQQLPDYMVPAAFVLLDALPMTVHGKVDRKALPAPDTAGMQRDYLAPQDPKALRLCELWQEILGLERVGMTDNFFELGGHSLSATRLLARIGQEFDLALPLKTLFDAQTPQSLLRELEQLTPGLQRPPLRPAARDTALPLSYGQQRLWLLDQIDAGSAHYNMPNALRLSGRLDTPALERALATIVGRHESLRTCFAAGPDGEPVQRIMEAPSFRVHRVDLAGLASGERQLRLAELVADEATRGFDLAADLMLRAGLIKLDETEHVLLLTMHHIAADGWSMGILVDEFSTLYRAFSAGQADPLAPLALQYADYALWQRNWLQGDVLEKQLAYWTGKLAALPTVHGLPLDYPRPAMQSFVGATYGMRLDAATGSALRALCQRSGATLFMALHAAFSVLLARYSNETDIVIGSPIANREQAEVAGLIGFFVNTLVLRADLSGNPGFLSLLQQSKRTLLDAYAHQQVPFEQLVERLQPQRSLSHTPLFQVMLVLQNNEQSSFDLPELTLHPVVQGVDAAKYDLSLNVSDDADGLSLGWQYNVDLFEAKTVERMAAHFEVLLRGMVEAPEAGVFGLPLLLPAEREQMLLAWNRTEMDFPHDRCIHTLFEQRAAAAPHTPALVCEGEQLSYGELNEQANRLAHYLISLGAGPDQLVGICVERSLSMVVGLLAILKAGAAYVPIDPVYPLERKAHMLEDARVRIMLTQHGQEAALPASDAAIVRIDRDAARWATLSAANPATAVTPACLAYVIYTSGSSGKPKGVALEHRALVNYVATHVQRHAIGAEDRLLQFASISFDAAGEEIYASLIAGATLVLRSADMSLEPLDLADKLGQWGITVLDLPTAYWHVFTAELAQARHALPAALRLVLIGGEAALPESVALWQSRWPAGPQLVNTYGPTETTIVATSFTCDSGAPGDAPIGRPVNNTQVYVLNSQGVPVPSGVAGELHIGGMQLARGYLHQPELTAAKFIPDPFGAAGGRLYKTGDLVRWRADGNLEYLGRIDQQVKIRGFRVELGEIENAVCASAQVKEAAVVARRTAGGEQMLAAYVVPVEPASASMLAASLRQSLAASLPAFMLPAAIVVMESLPLTPNGKIDRKALPHPDPAAMQQDYVAPRNALEQTLCAIWQDVLGVERVGLGDDFFALGGHSLLAVQMTAQVKRRLGVELALRTLFSASTVAALAAHIAADADAQPHAHLVAIRPQGTELPLFLVHPGEGEVDYARKLAHHIDLSVPVYGLAACGFLPGERPLASVSAMATHYIAAMREVQPKGPYRVAGWSAGGTISYEIVRQLLEAGETVGLLGLIDTTSHYSPEEAGLIGPATGSADHDDAACLWAELARAGDEAFAAELSALAACGAIDAMLGRCRERGMFPGDIGNDTLRRHVAVRAAITRALHAYLPAALPAAVPVAMFAAAGERRADPALGWEAVMGVQVKPTLIEGTHSTMMDGPGLGMLGTELGRILREPVVQA